MYPPAIAAQLRDRDHDAEAVTERTDLRALADIEIIALAQQEQRAVVTENIDDFSVIADGYDQPSQVHFGLVLVPPSSYPRGSPATIGRMVTELDRLLKEHPETTPTSLRHWTRLHNADRATSQTAPGPARMGCPPSPCKSPTSPPGAPRFPQAPPPAPAPQRCR
jgi:Domain of unknown function (DUF5615)